MQGQFCWDEQDLGFHCKVHANKGNPVAKFIGKIVTSLQKSYEIAKVIRKSRTQKDRAYPTRSFCSYFYGGGFQKEKERSKCQPS